MNHEIDAAAHRVGMELHRPEVCDVIAFTGLPVAVTKDRPTAEELASIVTASARHEHRFTRPEHERFTAHDLEALQQVLASAGMSLAELVEMLQNYPRTFGAMRHMVVGR